MNRKIKHFYQLKINIDSFCNCRECELGYSSFKILPAHSYAFCESIDFYKKMTYYINWDIQADCQFGGEKTTEIDLE